MQTELITIGITCFNAEGTIERAVQSARAQAWPSIEIVVVDDASTDGSWAVVQRFAAGESRLRAFRHAANRGVGAARNSVLERAAGEFVAFFDDDDVSLPERLFAQHRRIVEYERATGAPAVVCHTATEQRYPDGTTVYSPALGADATPGPSGDEVARLILLGQPTSGNRGVCPTSSQMARR
ncbi:MAG TPA: glycosyltransferase family 2 protein, partial [Candidatus Krumholzibacteria bacterium]|nr:glycosyltransferase family 2 protein [Candidatus Krumholzibacteria bacterium]